jgi:hypothetical protein
MQMRRVTTAAALMGGVMLAGLSLPATASAAEYPFCAMQGGRNSYESCSYYTIEQCRAAVSGVGGFCQVNPRYAATAPYPGDEWAAPPRARVRRGY